MPEAIEKAALPLPMRKRCFYHSQKRYHTGHVSFQSGGMLTHSLRTLSTHMGRLQHLSCQDENPPGEILDHHLGTAVARGRANSQVHSPTTAATAATTTQRHADEPALGIPILGRASPRGRSPQFTSFD